ERAARPRLVEEVVTEDVALAAEAAGNPCPGGRIATLDRDSARTGLVRPEVVEGPVEPRAGQVGGGKARHRVRRQPVGEHGPAGPALPAKLLVVEVLVEVDQREDPVAGEHTLGREQRADVVDEVAARWG